MKDLDHREFNQQGVLGLLKRGYSAVQLQEAYPQVSRSTIYHWLAKFRKHGPIERKASKALLKHSNARKAAIKLS